MSENGLTDKEIALAYGYSTSWVDKWVRLGRFRVVSQRRPRLIDPASVEEFIKEIESRPAPKWRRTLVVLSKMKNVENSTLMTTKSLYKRFKRLWRTMYSDEPPAYYSFVDNLCLWRHEFQKRKTNSKS